MDSYIKKIDDLGRVVIPKSIREKLGIVSFNDLVIGCNNDSIIIKKSNTLLNYENKLNIFISFIKKFFDIDICFFNNDIVINSYDIFYSLDYIRNEIDLNNIYIFNDNYILYGDKLIYDSNMLGYILFKSLKVYDYSFFKDIKELMLNIIFNY